MRKFFSVFLLCLAMFTVSFHRPVLAANVQNGAKVFSTNCASCHAGGQNLVKANKSLKKEDLQKYGMNSVQAIIAQVTNGKNAMPSFRARLKPEQIEDVAAYVLEQADKDWK